STLPDRPPDDDRFGQPDAGRHTDDDAPVPAGACHLSQLVVERERAIVGEETPGEPGVASDEPVDAVEDDAGGSSLGAQGQGVDREREIGRGAPRRAWGAREGHPSDPSISSFTSRLNSIAYSIGSSLVNTSRNPWTIRFWASFSVRPRLIR